MTLEDRWQFDLPRELIAQVPADRRGDSRLMLVEPGRGPVGERVFRELPGFLRPGDLMVLNDSRVLPARLFTRRVDTAGQVEVLLIRPVADGTWLAMAKPARRLRAGVQLAVGEQDFLLTVEEKRADGMILVSSHPDPAHLAEKFGVMPLPPYIHRQKDDPRATEDQKRYQTVYNLADDSGAGSVAAPTAGLHFSRQTMAALQEQGVRMARVSLHVGPGTFQPPTAAQVAAGRLHREFFRFSWEAARQIQETRARGGRIIAVGTTSLRVLETVDRLGLGADGPDHREFPAAGEQADPVFVGSAHRQELFWQVTGLTRLFIQPPERVRAADGLLTNFHLPGSSLLMLVAALAGEETWRRAYARAVQQKMRFYSYGDCMLILPGCGG